MKYRGVILNVCLLFFLTVPAIAADTLVCDYKTYSNESGKHPVKDKFGLTFIVDTEKGNAYILGSQGSDEVMMIPCSQGGFSFIEITSAGNVTVTTVDSTGKSVHSRNMVIHRELVPTQYYGKCIFK
jgi:hypothetical protein